MTSFSVVVCTIGLVAGWAQTVFASYGAENVLYIPFRLFHAKFEQHQGSINWEFLTKTHLVKAYGNRQTKASVITLNMKKEHFVENPPIDKKDVITFGGTADVSQNKFHEDCKKVAELIVKNGKWNWVRSEKIVIKRSKPAKLKRFLKKALKQMNNAQPEAPTKKIADDDRELNSDAAATICLPRELLLDFKYVGKWPHKFFSTGTKYLDVVLKENVEEGMGKFYGYRLALDKVSEALPSEGLNVNVNIRTRFKESDNSGDTQVVGSDAEVGHKEKSNGVEVGHNNDVELAIKQKIRRRRPKKKRRSKKAIEEPKDEPKEETKE